MRGYPKGTAWLIAPRLTDRSAVPAAQFTERMARGPRGAIGFETDEALARSFMQYLPTIAGETYRGWTVMLMDERTQSQAEHTGLFLKAANNTRFVGSRTAGADGDVTNVALPGNILVWFTGMAVRHPDGRPLQRTGLIPDILVKPTIRGIRAGRDEVLERALTYLRGLPPRRGAR
jgi:C-terminal processing protease CtpA/Prc